MKFFYFILQGIVQGLTEFLPVSASGHLVIIQHILGISNNNIFVNTLLHTGTLLALILAYHKLILRLFRAVFTIIGDMVMGRYRFSEMNEDENLLVMLLIGFIPLFLLFIPLPFSNGLDAVDIAAMLTNKNAYFIITGISTTVTGILLLLGYFSSNMTEKLYKKRGIVRKKGAGRRYLNVIDVISMGMVQMFSAIFPGLSRLVSVYVVGEMRGINRQKALDYAFLSSIPTITAAAIIECKQMIHTENILKAEKLLPLILGIVISAAVGLFSISFARWILKKKTVRYFVFYSIIVGIVITVISVIELKSGVNVFTGKYLVFI